jgi:two-component system, OmpR family, response regulator MprA
MTQPSKIIVADDEAAVRLVLNRFLTASGFSVIECRDGAEAFERIPCEKPAVALLDVEMPRLDGWQTLRELRQHGYRAPIMMLTRVDTVAARVKGLDSGADDFIGKPCDLLELLARIKALVRRSRVSPPAPRQLKIGDLVVDLERRMAWRGNLDVRLTRTDFALLEVFASHRDRPVSREHMLEQIWGTTAELNSHTLDTCLWRLRRKLGENDRSTAGWIRNLPGIGYMLEGARLLPADAE